MDDLEKCKTCPAAQLLNLLAIKEAATEVCTSPAATPGTASYYQTPAHLRARISVLNSRVFPQDQKQSDVEAKQEVVVTFISGSGGAEANDWTRQLSNMYIQWARIHDVDYSWVTSRAGEQTGIECATVWFRGKDIKKFFEHEHGVHRFVRLSPFDPQNRRHTSFATVRVNDMEESWDNQVRSVVLDPYQEVRNMVTGMSTDLVKEYLGGQVELAWP